MADLATHSLRRQRQMALLGWAFLFALLFFLPALVKMWKGDSGYSKEMGVWVMVAYMAIVALGCNVIVGYTGLLNLGFAGFYCIGAYTCGVLMRDFEVSFWVAAMAAMLHAALWGILLGIPTLRLSGDYFAIVTLVMAELILLIVKNWTDVTGGTGGFRGVPKPVFFDAEFNRMESTNFWYLAMSFLIASIFVMRRLERSRVGRAWVAIREDELAAQAAGINITWFKTLAFTISGAFAGLGGALMAVYIGNLDFNSFNFFISVFLVLYVIFGGSGSIVGTLIGTVLLFYSLEWLRDFIKDYNMGVDDPANRIPMPLRYMAYSALLIIVMRFRPSGLLPPKAKIYEKLPPADKRQGEMKTLRGAGGETVTPDESPLALECIEVAKHFGGVKAVEKASLSVERGSIVSLIGPNGAGKTTLFNTITGMYPVTGGKILFHDHRGETHDLTNGRPDRITAKGVARTFQNIRLFKDMTALDNVKIGLHSRVRSGVFGTVLRTPRQRREEREITMTCLNWLDFVGLGDQVGAQAGALAYGEQRTLEIARALATQPSLLLLDEPAAGLNPTETATLMALIRKIRDRGITVLLIEHDMKLVMEISEHITVLDHGEIICEGGPEKVRNDPQVVEAYLGHELTQEERDHADL